ncbi:TPR-like protein [Wolfiporia cocos MD-104 SS10]|uniref:TPR-like protein n=1 Tax=Wolfiporia cocos (strain MD-104) TaxID=742152 RepID=A0A2H3JN95_WOLCO|nr:TPR-like protein [Wolfiporia cocos MD-104 SS10]
MALSTVTAETVIALRDAVRDCSERGLSAASKWAAELLLSIPKSKRQAPDHITRSDFHTSTPPRSRSPGPPGAYDVCASAPVVSVDTAETILPLRHPHAPSLGSQPEKVRRQELEWEAHDADYIATARTLVNGKDFIRAASEKQALVDWYKLDKTRNQPTLPVNTSLLDLLEMVRNTEDPFLLFLKALFLCRLARKEEAIENALLSIAAYPWNWSTWSVLGECLGDGEEMFQVKTLNILHSSTDNELSLCDRLLGEDLFPRSLYVMSLRACVLYHMHDFKEAAAQFSKILAIDPYRIDDIDIYSNILYVTEDKYTLSKIAHEFTVIDKDRPEVCCLIGNYYSLRGEHEKAIKYFRRATQLDWTYLSAWTLMGHEYVEMKNSHAAIEAYRKAVDVNRKDYRAWYGLGQAYELLSMHQYALHYHQHATALRPYDVRIWQAQGICYEEMGRPREAIECLKRALIGADPHETTIHLKLAKLHNDLDEFAEAAIYHERVIAVCRTDTKDVADYAKSAVYVARYHIQHGGGDMLLAKQYLEEVAASNAEEPLSATNDTFTQRTQSDGAGSVNATPAPEPMTSALASSSTFEQDFITVGDDPKTDTNVSQDVTRAESAANLEVILARVKRRTAKKGRTTDEEQIMMETAARVASCLAADHLAVLRPDTQTPFADATDAIRRLLPYHVFQHPKGELGYAILKRTTASSKGKCKASEEDLMREEIVETKFALDCWRRRSALEKRFRRARIQEGKRPSPDDQAYFMAQVVLDAERTETANINVELRTARAELEKIEREKRATAPPVASRPAVPYYPTSSTPQAPAYPSQYRGYSYPYGQGYSSPYTFSPAFPTSQTTYPSTSAPNTASTSAQYSSPYNTQYTAPSTSPGSSTYTSPATYSGPTPVVPSTVPSAGAIGQPASAATAIPVQLPKTSLPALSAIGLEPVPISALPPAGQPRPPAVLKAQTDTVVNLEINVGSLQPAQMTGLALILNALTSRGVNVDGSARALAGATPASATTSAAEPPPQNTTE